MTETNRKTRWFRLSPDRLIVGLLAVEGFLLLSEQFQWFAFNEKKGWTVLIAVVAVCLAVVVMLLWFAASLLFRWRFQFSVRSLVVLVVGVAIPCCWLTVKMREAERQRKAVEAIRKVGWINYDYDLDKSGNLVWGQEPPSPAWLRRLLGDDFFAHALGVYLVTPEVGDVEHLKGLTELEYLKLSHTKTTDDWLVNVRGLTKLRYLLLSHTLVSDVGLKQIRKLTELTSLDLFCTEVTDAGLVTLKGLTRLEYLWLNTQVTDAGLESLKGLTKLKYLFLDDTQITDAGLQHLRGLTKLKALNLRNTQVTEEGIEELQEALPTCEIYWEPPPTTPTITRDRN